MADDTAPPAQAGQAGQNAPAQAGQAGQNAPAQAGQAGQDAPAQAGQAGQDALNAQGAQNAPAQAEQAGQAPPEYAPFTETAGGPAIDAETQAEFSALARELRLTQEQGQRLVEMGARKAAQVLGGIEAMRGEWRRKAESDPEITGGMEYAKRLVTRFGGPEFVKMINETGVGDHPDFIRFCIAAGRTLGEGPFVAAPRASGDVPSLLGGLAQTYAGKM